MRIIKHGNINNIMICTNCQCEFEYDDNDIKIELSEYITNSQICDRYVICPECGSKIYISSLHLYSTNTTTK